MREEDMDFNPHYEFAKGGKVEIEKAKRKLREAKKTKISSAIDDASRELDRVSKKYGYFAKGGKLNITKAELIDTDGVEYEIWQDSKTGKMFNVPIERLEDDSSGEPQIKRYLKEAVEVKDFAKGGKTKEMYFIETGMNTKSGEKKYTYEQGIKRIKSLLKQDKELLGGRKLSSISDDDIVEIGFNHYGFDYADNYAKGGKLEATHLQMSNLDKESAEQSAKIFEKYNKVVKVKKKRIIFIAYIQVQ